MLCDYTAGWISGVVALLIGHPFDTVKIQQQAHGFTIVEAVKKIKRHRGYKGFYRGLMVPLLSNGTLNAMFFGVYGDVCDHLVRLRTHKKEHLKHESHPEFEPLISDSGVVGRVRIEADEFQLGKSKPGATFSEMFLAGSIAGIVQLTLSAPMEMVKTKLQSQMRSKVFKGPLDCFVTVAREGGFRGIYRGLAPMTIRDCPGGGLYIVAYEAIQKSVDGDCSPSCLATVQFVGGGLAVGSGINFTVICSVMKLCEQDMYPSGWIDTLTATGMAGIASWWFVLPFDVIKTRMQADNHKLPQYRGMWHCAQDIYKTDGVPGLYRGFWSVTARAFPVNAATFLVYEFFQTLLCERAPYSKK